MTDESPKRDYAPLMKAALLELQQLRTRLDEVTRAQTEPVAIVGMGCRFPGGVDGPESFWRLLHRGVDAIREVPRDRWDVEAYYDANPDAPGTIATRSGGFLDKLDEFDPAFFGISPREARSLDPQQRLLLEVTWEALELAGQSPAQLYGSATGVFIGMSTFDYALHQVGGVVGADDLRRIDGYVATGSTMSPAAGRLSYVLGLNGPSMVVDTACSSSLVAVHLAVTSLRNRECSMALVGGVNVMLRPEWNVNFTKAHMLAPDGRCKTFDAAADGYSRGEGCGVVVLQRLSDALAARRNIVAVIRGSAINQDGASGGLTVPSGPSQEQVIRRALDAAGLRPGDISYVEAHGTGTSLGDPIEVAALGAVFGADHSRDRPLRIGSVKTNIGHLEAAAGVAGLIKVALSLRHGEIPPHLHFTHGNPLIDWAGLPIEVPVGGAAWPTGEAPRRAGLSSFGFTGTNAHVVLEEAPADGAGGVETGGATDALPRLLPTSARTPAALQQLAVRYRDSLAEHPDLVLSDVARTAATGRTHFPHRLAIVAASLADAQRMLAAHVAGEHPPGVLVGRGADRPKVAFLFTGQGSQYAGMGLQIYDTQPVFRAAFDRCAEILQRHLDRPLLDVIASRPGEAGPLDQTAYTQPGLFAVEYALAALWQSWGIEPDAVMGHSVGEYVAACVAGVFSLEDGLALVAQRARLMQTLPQRGGMVAVHASEERVVAAITALAADVSLAAINGPNQVVISGDSDGVSAVVASLEAAGIQTRALRVSHAFHSSLMEPMLDAFTRVARGVRFAPPAKTIISNVTGGAMGAEMATPEYWVRHVREPVRFAAGIDVLQKEGCRVFVEVGPSSTLLAMGRLCAPSADAAWLPSLHAGQDSERMLQSLAELYIRGANIDWSSVAGNALGRPVELPTYPFQRERHWVDIGRAQDRVQNRDVPSRTQEVADHLYAVEWIHHSPNDTATSRLPEGRWFVLADDGPVGTELVRELRGRGEPCTLVSAGDAFTRLGDEHFQIDRGEPGDLDRLWTAALTGERVRGIVYLWGLDTPPATDLLVGEEPRWDALASALHVVGAASRGRWETAPAIWIATRGAVPVGEMTTGVAVAVTQAPLWGFGRVVALEHPEIWGGLLDLDPAEDAPSDARAITRELLSASDDDQVAFRAGTRRVPRLVRRVESTARAVVLDSTGTYLVMGGLGALGRHAARWLVSKGARSLVLASRRGAATPGAESAIRELESMGADSVVVAKADVSSRADVERVLAGIAESGARLRGVVHAAGVDAPIPLDEMTTGGLRSMLASKVGGGWLLHEATRGLDLDLFICFSSVSSIWGAPRRAHYAAANAFLDALAHERRRQGLPGLSINWGPWREGGMATGEELGQLDRSGMRGLDPASALRALDVLVAGADVQAAVADVDWPRFRPLLEARRPRPLLSHVDDDHPGETPVTGRAQADWLERLKDLPASERIGVLEQLVQAEVAGTLGYASPQAVPVDQSVFELGMDSLRAVELSIRLQRHLGLDRPIPFFDSPQVTALTQRLLAEITRLGTVTAAVPVIAAASAPGPGAAVAALAQSASPTVVEGFTGYAPEREPEIREFALTAWPDRPQALIAPRWRWMFVESAERVARDPSVWLYREGGRVVAHHAAMPVRLEVGSETFDSAWFADTMVLESHRSQALGAQLLLDSNEEFPVGLSLGQSEQMREIALRLGWEQVAALQTFLLMLRPRRVLGSKLNPFVAGIAGSGLSMQQYMKRRLAGVRGQGLEARTVDRFDARHDGLWASVREEYTCAVTRDASYLNWKYVTQPGQNFIRLEFLRQGQVAAIAVIAVDDPGVIYRYRRAFLVELVVRASDTRLVLGVLNAIRHHCAQLKVDAILFHVINAPLERAAQAFGFMRRDPTRYLLVNAQRASPETRRQLLSPANWLVTMGDSDIDRPWEVAGALVQSRATRVSPGPPPSPTPHDASVV